ncbi:hypothetical protein BGZ98_004835 [Dissophora globulifera]|nr:hypothetical protein BGZ98_004835 [Dissophora globulifera]
MGLRGTTDSILDLGALGQVEVKGIPIDVFAPVAGLQGLKNVDFLLSMQTQVVVNDAGLFIELMAYVDIHNPSNLTLNIGDLRLTGVTDFATKEQLAYVLMSDLTLMPGDNRIVADSWVDFLHPAGADFGGTVITSAVPIPMYLISLDDATSNIALNAGLSELQTSVLIPPHLLDLGATIPLAYSLTDMSIKFLPTTVDDGLVEMTATFLNPFVDGSYELIGITPGTSSLSYPTGTTPIFDLISDFTFSLPANDSIAVTFKIQLRSNPSAADRSVYQSMVTDSALGSVTFSMAFFPLIKVGKDTKEYTANWSSNFMAPATGGLLTFKAGSDFGLILDWYDRQFPAVAVTATTTASMAPTTAAPSPTSTADAVMSTSPAPSPSPVATTTVDPAPPATTVV